MKRTLLVGASALLFACGRGQQSTDNRTPTEAAARPVSAAGNVVPAPTGDGRSSQSTQKVALVGCLQGSPSLETTGTAGTSARARATAPETVAAGSPGDRTSDRFILVDAVAAPESAGVGANGAGGSGGPLVTGKSSFELDGIPATARASVHKQVRIVGSIAAASDPVGTSATGDHAAPAASRSGGAINAASATGGGGMEMRRLLVDTIDIVASTCPQ